MDEEYEFVHWQDENGKVLSEEEVLTLTCDTDLSVRAMYLSRYGENLALHKSVTASSTVTTTMFGTEKLTDGVYTVKGTNEGYTSLETSETQWVQIDLGGVYSVKRVKLVPRNNGTDDGYGIPINMEILVSEDGQTWTEVYAVKDLARPTVSYLAYDFSAINARYVKINGSVLRQNPADGGRKRLQLSEVEVYGDSEEILKNNLALNKPVEVSSAQPVTKFKPEFATDGKYTVIGTNEGWTTYPETSAWITVDLGQDCTVREVALFPRVDGSNDGYGIPEDLEILVSMDGKEWKEVYAVTGQPYAGANTLFYKFADTAARYVKVNGSKLRPNPADANQYRMQLAELEVYGDVGVKAANLALNQPVTVSTSQAVSYFNPVFVTDGVYTENLTNEGWTSMPNNETEWVYVDLGKLSAIDEVKVVARKDGTNDGYGIPVDMEILVSDDGETWTEIYAVKDLERPTEEVLSYEFDGVVGRYVKVHGSRLRANPMDHNQYRMQIAELEVYGLYLEDAAVVERLIDAIGEVTLESGDAIAAARAAYDALEADQQAEVENLAVLEAAEAAYDALVKREAGAVISLTGDTEARVDAERVSYTVWVENALQMATIAMTIDMDDAYLGEPKVEAAGGFFVLASKYENGKFHVVLCNNDGLTDENAVAILKLTAPVLGNAGDAVVAVTAVETACYEGEGEIYGKVTWDEASVTTTVAYSTYDVNKDGKVNQLDLTRIQRWYGLYHPTCDVNADGSVDVADMILVANNYTE